MGYSLPTVRVTGLVDGEWQELGGVEGRAVDHSRDFPAIAVPLADDAPAVRQLRLEIAAREEGQRLIIPEVEVWARE